MKVKKIITFALLIVMAFSLVGPYSITAKVKKTTIRKKSYTLVIGQKKSISLKNKKKKARYTFSSSKKKIVTVSKKGLLKARKAGKAKITVREKYKGKLRKLGVVKVTVRKKKTVVSQTPKPQTQTYTVPDGFDQAKENVTYGTLSVISYDSTTTGTKRKANVLLPANYSVDKKYPILYLLHGIGGDHTEWLGGNPKYVVGNLIANGLAKDMIVVMPNVRARANDKANPSDIFSIDHYRAFDNFINDLTKDLMPYMEQHYSIAKGRNNTAIAGLSMGGRESLYIGFTLPQTFGYIGAFCPAPGILPYTMNGVTEQGLFSTKTFKLSDLYNHKTKVMIVAGESDHVVGTNPYDYHMALTNNKTEHIYYTTDGGHDFNVWKNGLYHFTRTLF